MGWWWFRLLLLLWLLLLLHSNEEERWRRIRTVTACNDEYGRAVKKERRRGIGKILPVLFTEVEKQNELASQQNLGQAR